MSYVLTHTFLSALDTMVAPGMFSILSCDQCRLSQAGGFLSLVHPAAGRVGARCVTLAHGVHLLTGYTCSHRGERCPFQINVQCSAAIHFLQSEGEGLDI